jgi:hypothetical protein
MMTGPTVAVLESCVARSLLLPQLRTGVLVLRAFFGIGFEYSLKDLLDRLDWLYAR